MGCCGDREKLPNVKVEQKWEYINLDDFRSTSCWTPLSYGVLYISIIISIAVYAVDTFTAVNLLAFDRWSGQIKPFLPLKYSRWIFAGCIILSFLLLFVRWLRALRVMKQGGVAQSYLDPLAVRIQSVRMGKEGRGWKRFLVFAELTKGKKGADYVALFTYYSFEAWLRILFAEGPRQVINALTLYSVMRLSLIPTGEKAAKDGHTPVVQFFVNVGVLADEEGKMAAVILFGMLFTVVIWVFTLLNLMAAVLMYLFFLFHHIPSTDGGLSAFCRRKINKSMEKIVKVKVEKALRKENALRARQEARQGPDAIKRQPTLPNLESAGKEGLPALSRQPTQSTLPEYSSRPGTATPSPSDLERQPTLPNLDTRPGTLARTDTHASSASWASQGSNAPLISSAGEMGYGPPGRIQSPSSVISPTGSYSSRAPSYRTHAPSQRSYTPNGGPRSGMGSVRSAGGTYQMEPVSRSGTMNSGRAPSRGGPSPVDSYGRRTPAEQQNPYFPASPSYQTDPSAPPLPRSNTPASASNRSYTPGAPSTTRSITPAASYNRPYTPRQGSLPVSSPQSANPSQSYQSFQNYPQQTRSPVQTASASSENRYQPYSPASASVPTPGGYYQQPSHQTMPYQPSSGHAPRSQRSGSARPTNRQNAPVADNVMEDIMNGY